MVIQHNMAALNANRQFGIVSDKIASSTEKLSSGYRINRSADDAAGLSISEKMRKQIRGLDRASKNIEDGISYAQVADGALNEVHDILQRINELAVQSANGTNSESDRAHINDEVQQLKAEMERIFITTTFNEKQIWKENLTIYKNVIGQVKVQSTTVSTPRTQYLTVDNQSYGLLAAGSPAKSSPISDDYHLFTNNPSYYNINADANGVSISWTAFNGTNYKTKTATWNELREKKFQFNIGDYFENKDADGNVITDSNKQLLDVNGNPKFDFGISLNVVTGATDEQIAQAINGTYMMQGLSSNTTFEDEGNTIRNAGLTLVSQSLVYAAAYADSALADKNGGSGYDFEIPSDNFIKAVKNPSGGNLTSIPNQGASVSTARNSTDKWQFSFEMEGLGNLTATSSQVSYYSRDTDVTPSPAVTPQSVNTVSWSGPDLDDQGIFWQPGYNLYRIPPSYTYEKHWRPSAIHRTIGDGTLGDVMKTLTGRSGLLSKGNNGGTDKGGYVYITFDLTSDTPYTYGKDASGNALQSNIVGSFALQFSVSATDTEKTILDKLNTAFNSNTLVDFNFSNSTQITAYVNSSRENISSMMKNDFLPQEKVNDINLNIHSGSETTDKIRFDYECLRLKTIGLSDTNVLTQENALSAIDEVNYALEIISAQRSLFGAYQNRMEHAYNIDKNSSENTQAAESQIRDTDMAEEMVRYSNNNILGQAGTSILAQANQANQGILSLLK